MESEDSFSHQSEEQISQIIELDNPIRSTKVKTWKDKIAIGIEHWSVVTFMSAITIYSLFFDDLRMIVFELEQDNIFYGITALCLFAFSLEIVLASISKYDEYFNSFFFWLDVVSTVSLIQDIGWIMDLLLGGSSSGDQASLAKSARAGRITRIIRIIRLIRLIRIVKLYKQARLAQKRR
jgi:hypothetical protein